MNLSYRGTTYQQSGSAFEIANAQQIGQFLGNPFEIKQFSSTPRHSSSTPLKYRGARYIA